MKKQRFTYRRVRYYVSNKKGLKLGRFLGYIVLILLCAFFIYKGANKLMEKIYNADAMIIKEIEVTGTKNLTKAEIKELLPFDIYDNMLKVDLSDAEKTILKIKPEIKKISIGRRLKKIKIKITERVPEAFVYDNNTLKGIDFENTVFPLRGFMAGMKIPVINYQNQQERDLLLAFLKKFKPVCKEFLSNIEQLKYSQTGDLVFKTHDGIEIYWGGQLQDSQNKKFRVFEKIYVDAIAKYNKIDFIDMSYYNLGRAIVRIVN